MTTGTDEILGFCLALLNNLKVVEYPDWAS